MYIKIDGFRFISHLHTTSRQLYICSEIIRELGTSQLPKEIIQERIFQWSLKEEKRNSQYSQSRGKITEEGKKTTAFAHYLDLCGSLGLVNSFNNIYSNSRLGSILFSFIVSEKEKIYNISQIQSIFYLLQLLRIDADGLLLILDLLNQFGDINQKDLQKKFKETLNIRLLAKQSGASSTIRILINEKFRAVNYVWKNPEKYAEHLLIPRCEWLTTVGVLMQKREKSSTVYSLTEFGKGLYFNLPFCSESLKDINEEWINCNFFSLFNNLTCKQEKKEFKNFSCTEKTELLGKFLEETVNTIKTSNSFRYPVYESLIFICINMYKNNVVINFYEIVEFLEVGVNYNKRNFLIRNNGRLNESYIIIRPI